MDQGMHPLNAGARASLLGSGPPGKATWLQADLFHGHPPLAARQWGPSPSAVWPLFFSHLEMQGKITRERAAAEGPACPCFSIFIFPFAFLLLR